MSDPTEVAQQPPVGTAPIVPNAVDPSTPAAQQSVDPSKPAQLKPDLITTADELRLDFETAIQELRQVKKGATHVNYYATGGNYYNYYISFADYDIGNLLDNVKKLQPRNSFECYYFSIDGNTPKNVVNVDSDGKLNPPLKREYVSYGYPASLHAVYFKMPERTPPLRWEGPQTFSTKKTQSKEKSPQQKAINHRLTSLIFNLC